MWRPSASRKRLKPEGPRRCKTARFTKARSALPMRPEHIRRHPVSREKMVELAGRVETATADERYDWTGIPHWAAYGGEHYDNGWVPDCGGKTDYDPGLL